jgi:hypothetical protein
MLNTDRSDICATSTGRSIRLTEPRGISDQASAVPQSLTLSTKLVGTAPRSFWSRVANEIEPVLSHAIVALVLETVVLLLGLGALALRYISPGHLSFVELIETIDIGVAIILASMFGLYTLILVAIRLIRSVMEEWGRQADTAGRGRVA